MHEILIHILTHTIRRNHNIIRKTQTQWWGSTLKSETLLNLSRKTRSCLMELIGSRKTKLSISPVRICFAMKNIYPTKQLYFKWASTLTRPRLFMMSPMWALISFKLINHDMFQRASVSLRSHNSPCKLDEPVTEL